MSKYKYVHKDGRQAEHWSGTWPAIRDALGPQEASTTVEFSEAVRWVETRERLDEGYYRKADLIVSGERVGTFFN